MTLLHQYQSAIAESKGFKLDYGSGGKIVLRHCRKSAEWLNTLLSEHPFLNSLLL